MGDEEEAAIAELGAAQAEAEARETALDKMEKTDPLFGAKSSLLVTAAERVRHARDALAGLKRQRALLAQAAGLSSRKRRHPEDLSEVSESGSEGVTEDTSDSEDDDLDGIFCYECEGPVYWDVDEDGDDCHGCDCGATGLACDCNIHCDDCDERFCDCDWHNDCPAVSAE